MSTITSFTVTNIDIGKFKFDWIVSGPAPQKITISIYSDSGYTTLVYTYSTDSYISTSGQIDFNVTDTSFTIPNTLSTGTTYYSQISIIPQGVTSITISIYVSSNQNVPIPKVSVNQSSIIPLNYATPVVYNYNSIGSYYLAGTPSAYFNGFINNLSLYNRTLTTTEISNYFRFSDNLTSFTTPVYPPLPIKLSNFYQTVADVPMYLYFDADSLNQIQGYYAGSSIGLWNNLGTDGNAASLNARGAFVGTGTGGYLPTLQQTGGANNYRYFVQFAGSGTCDSGPGNFFTLPSMQFNYTTGFTFIFVANIPASGNYDRIIDFGNSAGAVSDNIVIARYSTGANLALYLANSTTAIINYTLPSSTALDATWRIYAVRITGSNYHYFYNTGTGTKLIDTSSLGTTPASRTYTSAHYTSNGSTRYGSFIGRSNFNDAFSSMKLGELLVYRSALSDNAINGIINVMQKRWNLDTSRTNIDFEFTQNVATFPGTDNTGKTLTSTAPPGMYNDSTRGYVVSLNGSTQFFGISSYNIGASYTKMFWIYLNSLSGGACHIMSSTNSASSGVHYAYFPSGISNLSFGHSSGTTVLPIVTDPQPLISGVWVHYTVTYENASGAASGYSQYAMTLYRNGQQVAQVTNSANTWTGGSATTGVSIGAFGGTVTGFNGYLDKMRIYSRALKQTELQLIYNSEKLNIPVQNYTISSATPKLYVTDSLQLYYDFAMGSYPGSGLLLYDLSTNAANLTFSGTPTINSSPPSLSNSSGVTATGSLVINMTPNGFTLEALFNVASNNNAYCTLFYINRASNTDTYTIQLTNTYLLYTYLNPPGTATTWNAGTISINTWYHYVISVTSGGTWTTYLNKNQINTGTTAYSEQLNAVKQIFLSDGGTSLNGKIALVRLYTRNLSLAEITKNYNSIKTNNSGYGLA